MVNFGVNIASLIGLLNCLFALFYFGLSIAQLIVSIRQSGSTIDLAMRLPQILIAPSCLLVSGLILFFQGWRYDPIMQFGLLLTEFLLVYYIVRDIRSMNSNP